MAGIDPNIILAGTSRPAAVGFDPADIVRLKVQMDQAKMQQAMQAYEMQKAEQASARQNQLQGLTGMGGTPQQMQQRLLEGGFIDEAGKVGDQGIKAQGADIAKQKQSLELMKQAANAVFANPTEQSAISAITQLEQATGQNLDQARAEVYSLKGDPNAIKRWAAGHALQADQLLPKTDTRDLGGTVETRRIDPLTGQPIGETEIRQKTMTPDQIENNRIANANLGIARQRLALDREKNDRESVAQQKLDLKLEEDARKAGIKERETLQTVDNTLSKLDQILGTGKNDGMVNQGTAGLIGKVSSFIPQTPAYNLEKKIDSVKAALGFDTLQAMRDASPTGGALGQVAVRELEFLQAKVASLDIGQSPAQLAQHLKEIQSHYRKWRAAVEGSAREVQGRTSAKQTNFDSMPDPAQYSGRRIKAEDGTIYKSNGSKWVRQ